MRSKAMPPDLMTGRCGMPPASHPFWASPYRFLQALSNRSIGYGASSAANASLLPELRGEHFWQLAQQTGRLLWSQELVPNTSTEAASNVAQALDEGNTLREDLGHYQGGTLYFDGEWFWGADRLPRLWERLAAEGYCDANLPVFDPYHIGTAARLKATGPVSAGVKLEYYPSLRSPYSAIAHAEVERLTTTTQAELVLRPVMPMLMRGVTAPRHKQRYIITDCAREARARDILSVTLLIPLVNPLSAVSLYSPVPWPRVRAWLSSAHFSAPPLHRVSTSTRKRAYAR